MPSGVDASGRAAIAIRYAMAQVGKAYVYGAAGPNAFDCSGLMMMAWAQAGIVAAALVQRPVRHRAGTSPPSDLQPGDLVFYYSPISHVAMYIGNGLIVEAANPGAGDPRVRRLLDAVLRRDPPGLTVPAPTRLTHSGHVGSPLVGARRRPHGAGASWSRW